MRDPGRNNVISFIIAALIGIILALGLYVYFLNKQAAAKEERTEIWPISTKKLGDGFITELQFSVNSTNSLRHLVPDYLITTTKPKFTFLTYENLSRIPDKKYRIPMDQRIFDVYPQNIDIPVTIDRLKRGNPIWEVSLLIKPIK